MCHFPDGNAALLFSPPLIPELIAALQIDFAVHSTATWMTALGGGREFPCAPINSLRAALDEHAQVRHLNVVQSVAHPTAGAVRVVRSPVTFSATPSDATRRAPPLLGQHTDEVLGASEWGVAADATRLQQWRNDGVIL